MSLLKFKYGQGVPTLSAGEIGISTDLHKIFVNPNGTQINIDNYQYKEVSDGTTFAQALTSMTKISGTFYVVKDSKAASAEYVNQGSALYYCDGTNFVELSNTGDLVLAISTLNDKFINLNTGKADKDDLNKYVAKAGDTMSGSLHMGTGTDGVEGATYNKITHVADPIDAHDAANKAYVDALEEKLDDVTTVMNFVGTIVPSGDNASTGKHGDVGIDTTGKEYVFIASSPETDLTAGAWRELGDVNAQNTAITDLQKLLYAGNNSSTTSTPAAGTVMKDIDDLQNTVGTNSHTTDGDPLKDKTLWTAVSDLRDDLGQKSDSATAETANEATVNAADAFARLKRLEASLGRKADSASASGSAYARVAKNANDIANVNTSINQLRKELGTAPENFNINTGMPNVWDCLTWHTW